MKLKNPKYLLIGTLKGSTDHCVKLFESTDRDRMVKILQDTASNGMRGEYYSRLEVVIVMGTVTYP